MSRCESFIFNFYLCVLLFILPNPIKAENSKAIKKVFPEKSVQIWNSDRKCLYVLKKNLIEWIELGQKYGRKGVFPESVRINRMLLEAIDDYLFVEAVRRTYLEIDQKSIFLVAIVEEKIHGLALLGGDLEQRYTLKVEYLSVSPSNLDESSFASSFRYVGSSIIEKSLDLSDMIVLQSENKYSSAAYQKMGFINLDADKSSSNSLGLGVLFGDAADKLRHKLATLRRKS